MTEAAETATLPAGACDTHVHVFLPERYPYADDRAYTPGRITASDLGRFLDAHGLARVVIVQPSVYAADNRAMLDAIRELGPRARGIAVVDLATVTDTALADLDHAGIVGIRLNVATRAEGGLAELARRADQRLAGTRWSIQVYAPLAAITEAAPTLARLSRPLILDHFAGAHLADGKPPAGLDIAIDLARNGPAYLKVSAAYRVTGSKQPGWPDVAPLAQRIIEAAPDRVIWGSDWPHTGSGRASRSIAEIEPFQQIDDRLALDCLTRWTGSPDLLRRILVDTPARLYGF